jgi:short-subunit dehydrogenase
MPSLLFAPARLAALALCVASLAGCAISPRAGPDDERRIAGKTFVITGASSGFGRGVALRLGAAGANVVVAARSVDALTVVASELTAAGGRALVVGADVANPGDIERLMAAAVARFGRVDVWINNAGVGAIGRFDDIPLEDHARLIDINLKGVIYGSHVALRQFRAQGAGVLVNIGSVESQVPLAYQASYAASKAGVLSLGRTLNEELRLAGLCGVQVVTVMPWAAATPFFRHTANYSGHVPTMVAMDDPQKVVDAIVWVTVNPVEELPVGWKSVGGYASHRMLPDLTERLSADIAHRAQMQDAPPAASTAGTLHRTVGTPAGR